MLPIFLAVPAFFVFAMPGTDFTSTDLAIMWSFIIVPVADTIEPPLRLLIEKNLPFIRTEALLASTIIVLPFIARVKVLPTGEPFTMPDMVVVAAGLVAIVDMWLFCMGLVPWANAPTESASIADTATKFKIFFTF